MAAARSFQSSPEGVELIQRALDERKWSRDDLLKNAEDCNSRQPVVNFCSGKKRVSKKLFVGFCELLGLDWEVIAGLKNVTEASRTSGQAKNIEEVVQGIRQQVKADIQNRCGTMRVLDMEQPIGIGDIYTSVNILEKVLGRRRADITALMEDCGIEDFDRFALGQTRQERVLGLKAVERYDRLMILGKPGAGKTTFMKRLAVLCNQGTFQAKRVPVFVTLKEFAEADGHPDLLKYVERQWAACAVEESVPIHGLMKVGRALVLLDGLDEVQETEHDRVLNCIEGFTREFQDCQFVMTCRIAAREYVFQQFTEVEIADFNQEQVNEFATKWFAVKNDEEKGENFIRRLKDNEPIQELATNPLLLTLLCLVFGEAADFPQNRAELYKEGLDVLLKKWDAKRNIERDKIYKKLSLKRKEDLLAQLAFSTFEQGNYFFKQRIVEQKIVDYIQNLPNAKEDEEALLLDSEAVLKSIEAQHGLLVERARGIYSFSHLTFHEYLTAKQIVSSSTHAQERLYMLATHVEEERYREVFLLVVETLSQADEFLFHVKQQVDKIVANERVVQQALMNVQQKTLSLKLKCKPIAARVFYLNLAFNQTRINLGSDFDTALDYSLDFDVDHDIGFTLDRIHNLCSLVNRNIDSDLIPILKRDLELSLNRVCAGTCNLERSSKVYSNLRVRANELREQLPEYKSNSFKRWWKCYGETWANSFRETMVEYRNIGHDWRLTLREEEKIRRYYYANQLLVDCLNSDCYVTKATRQYIEDTLLLPMSEIEKIPSPPEL